MLSEMTANGFTRTRPHGGVKAGQHRRGYQFAASLFQLVNFAVSAD
jgi:hypothetical protein